MFSWLEKKLAFLVFVFICILFFLKSFYFLDPDFGWHLRMGELILKSGIPATDPFSYTMPSFPFVDHEWGSNILFYLLFRVLGWLGLSIIISFIAILSIIISFKLKLKNFFSLPFLLAGSSLVIFTGIRPQVITWIFFSILITIFLEKKYFEKLRLFLPLFFLLWANLHAGFALGIFTYFLFLALKMYKEQKVHFIDLTLFIFSVLATLINPYGIKLWGEVYMQMSDSSLRWIIEEWKPLFFSFYPPLLLFLAISFFFLIRFRKSFGIFEKTLYFSLLIAGLSSIRHMALWTIVALPIFSKSLFLFNQEAKKIKYGQERFKKAYIFFMLLVFIATLVSIFSTRKNPLIQSEEDFYPKKAVSFLKANPSPGQVFSEYTWAGYLIWKYPEKKVFIDGRMPSWRWNTETTGESKYIFKEYRDLLSGKTRINDVAKKYNIDTVLFPAEVKKEKSFVDRLSEWFEAKSNKEEKRENIYSQLKKDGWKVVYKDDTAVIYRKD